MLYGQYKNVRDAAWRVLIECNITALPVSVSLIANHYGIKLLKNSLVPNEYKLNEQELGCTILTDNKWYIIFDNKLPDTTNRFTIAHELGHICLGHLLENQQQFEIEYRTFLKRNIEEQSADMFSARLLAPACVLWGLNLHTPEEIQHRCNISWSAAVNRAKRMTILYKRDLFLSSPLERQVFKQFYPFIEEHKKT